MMLDKIIIRDLLTRGPIGISEEERACPQDILINAELYTDTSKAAVSDSIDDCVNYSSISKKITELAKNNTRRSLCTGYSRYVFGT